MRARASSPAHARNYRFKVRGIKEPRDARQLVLTPEEHSAMWTLLLALLLVFTSSVRSLDSNIIRSSRETLDAPQTVPLSQRDVVDVGARNTMRRRPDRQGGAACSLEQVNECRGLKKRQRQSGRSKLPPADAGKGRVSEMGECVRSRDCEEGLCCAQYLMGRRCQRIPTAGELCLLRGRSKTRRNPDRCDCAAGLRCQPQHGGLRGQGVCHL